MKIIHIETQKIVKKQKKELEKDLAECGNNRRKELFVNEYKDIPRKEPLYIVEMSMEELKLVSFYLELEKRKPIMNVEIDAKLKGEK